MANAIEQIIGLVIFIVIIIISIYSKSKNDELHAMSTDKQDENEQRGLSRVTDSLWISNYRTSCDYDLLRNNGIKQILSIGSELPSHRNDEFNVMHIRLFDIPIENISDHFDKTYEFISRAPTLVHCFAGISRSATIVIAYLMRRYNMPYEIALDYLKCKRRIINPNSGFKKQLQNYSKKLRAIL